MKPSAVALGSDPEFSRDMFVAAVRGWLKDEERTQTYLAAKAGISKSSLSEYLSGKHAWLGTEYFLRVCVVINRSPLEFMRHRSRFGFGPSAY